MTVLKKYDLSGKEVGEVKIDDSMLQAQANKQMIKDYLVAIRANARQWSANTKTRPEVSHSGQKPHPQKGTGRARQGYLGAAQYKGGGRIFGPRPKFDQHVRINKKERNAAVRHLLSEKILDNKVHVLQYQSLDEPKTKTLHNFLRNRGLENKRVLFLADCSFRAEGNGDKSLPPSARFETLSKSLRNIPKVEFSYVPNVSGYDVVLHTEIVLLDSAFDGLLVLLGGK